MPPPPEAMPLRPYPGGYYSQGYYYPAPTVTTVIIQPGVSTTTTTYVEEDVTPSRRKWRSKTRCGLNHRVQKLHTRIKDGKRRAIRRSEEHTSERQSHKR